MFTDLEPMPQMPNPLSRALPSTVMLALEISKALAHALFKVLNALYSDLPELVSLPFVFTYSTSGAACKSTFFNNSIVKSESLVLNSLLNSLYPTI